MARFLFELSQQGWVSQTAGLNPFGALIQHVKESWTVNFFGFLSFDFMSYDVSQVTIYPY